MNSTHIYDLSNKQNQHDIVEDACMDAMKEAARPEQQTHYGEILQKPTDTAEIYNALRTGGRNIAPGSDGLGLEFYTTNWTVTREDLCDILNQMYRAITSHTSKNME
jgi:N-acetylmuramoyl-L-alanine amidase CwlA